MKVQTKSEMEAEIIRLRNRVAELEGEIAGLKFALAHKAPEPVKYPDYQPWVWPNTMPVWEVPHPGYTPLTPTITC